MVTAMAIGAVAVVAGGGFVVAGPHGRDSSAVTARASDRPIAPVSTTPTIAQLETRITTHPTDLAAWQQLSRDYLLEAIRSGDPAYYDLTRRALDTSARLKPGDHTTTVTEGVLALSLHDFAHAHEVGAVAHRQDPVDDDALAILVDASVELGRYDEAATHEGELLALRPGSSALSRLSYLRELHGDLDGARLAMLQAEQAAGSPADLATIATFVGDAQLTARDLTGAAASYDTARKASSGLVNTEIGRARLQAARGDLPGAIVILGAVVDRTPTAAAATALGELQDAAGRSAEARASYGLARAGYRLLVAAGSTVDLESALFEADHGDPNVAVELGRAAYDARHTVFAADAYAWALSRAGHPQEARPYIAASLRLGTRSPILHAHAAITYAAIGDTAAAARELRVAFSSSAWLVPSLRPAATALADRLHVAVPTDWRP
jgi:tetratricopeptide (TPR) repeat protein